MASATATVIIVSSAKSHSGQQFTGNLVHVGNHQQQTLRSGVGGGQLTGLQHLIFDTHLTAPNTTSRHPVGDPSATIRRNPYTTLKNSAL
jgi:hypothetical protein